MRYLVTSTGFLREAPPAASAWGIERGIFLRRLDEQSHGARDVTWVSEADLAGIAELVVRCRPNVIVSVGSIQTVSVLSGNGGIPVVAWGYAATLVERPTPELCGFRLPTDTQRRSLLVLRSLIPDVDVVAALYDARYPPGRIALAEARAAAAELGIALAVYATEDEAAIDAAFSDMPGRGIRAARVMLSPFLARQAEVLARRALAARVGLMSYDGTTRAGGLAAYVPDMTRTAVLIADLAHAVAHGAAPSDHGIRPCPMKLELNAATARALAITIPTELERQASRIYE